jgi:hypothetical protein
MSLADRINRLYLRHHTAKEESFWALYMGLKSSRPGQFEKKESAWKEFISRPVWIPRIEKVLSRRKLPVEERLALDGWLRFFRTHAIEDQAARYLQTRIISLEGDLGRFREKLPCGYTDPVSENFEACGSSRLSLMINTGKTEALRKAAWEGLRAIEQPILDAGFPAIVRERNRLGRNLGYSDYYDWKVTVNEQISKERLFKILDELKRGTEEPFRNIREQLKARHGAEAVKPWNLRYHTQGNLVTQMDPWFPFERALDWWGRSFTAMGVNFRGARLKLDLVYRKGKHENGFMHGPVPCYMRKGRFYPSRINFTAVAHPGETGGGQRALETLMHEGGHAAHFSNILMPAACFSQEFAPTSVALAETQSMFMDTLLEDPVWLLRYCEDRDGIPLPRDLARQSLENHITHLPLELRALLVIPYAERAIYELPDNEINAANILRVIRETERDFFLGEESPRPVMSVPHLLAGESSAYYHAYTLAWMGVFQLREHFLETCGEIVDNPKVGRELSRFCWEPGNAVDFFTAIKNCTGKEFGAGAVNRLIANPVDTLFKQALDRLEKLERDTPLCRRTELQADIRMVHGDKLLASNDKSFEKMSDDYEKGLRALGCFSKGD